MYINVHVFHENTCTCVLEALKETKREWTVDLDGLEVTHWGGAGPLLTLQ